MTGSAAFPADVAALLEGLEPGRTLWMQGLGRSMWPLLHPGSEIRVLRCEPVQLSPGDTVFSVLPSGQPVVHLLLATTPVRTAGLLRSEDVPGGRLLGKVVAVKLKGREVPFPSAVGPLLLGTRTAARMPVLLGAARVARRLLRE